MSEGDARVVLTEFMAWLARENCQETGYIAYSGFTAREVLQALHMLVPPVEATTERSGQG